MAAMEVESASTSTSCGEVEIDGAQLEGGGQIMRLSLGLSLLTRRPVRIHSIRKSRPKPGLARQHLSGAMLLADMGGAEISHAEVGSTELTLNPTPSGRGGGGQPRTLVADPGTAGAITLLLQAALPPALAFPLETLVLRGGTNVNFSPSIDYALLAHAPLLERFGVPAHLAVVARRFNSQVSAACERTRQSARWPTSPPVRRPPDSH